MLLLIVFSIPYHLDQLLALTTSGLHEGLIPFPQALSDINDRALFERQSLLFLQHHASIEELYSCLYAHHHPGKTVIPDHKLYVGLYGQVSQAQECVYPNHLANHFLMGYRRNNCLDGLNSQKYHRFVWFGVALSSYLAA